MINISTASKLTGIRIITPSTAQIHRELVCYSCPAEFSFPVVTTASQDSQIKYSHTALQISLHSSKLHFQINSKKEECLPNKQSEL